jgi:hypothetical protein
VVVEVVIAMGVWVGTAAVVKLFINNNLEVHIFAEAHCNTH